jgi:hypothetical protein
MALIGIRQTTEGSKAIIVPLVDVLNYGSEEDEDGEEFNKEEKCIFFEVE